jgi:hypothetical protein
MAMESMGSADCIPREVQLPESSHAESAAEHKDAMYSHAMQASQHECWSQVPPGRLS